ncbi:hypothetical protein MLD38_022012 [Melastoma candidum]|uniref:Uncharacterized protein n=1 Tax=Melastoma candidum TaxID=119954 RepID=A0ACB9QHR3_9MYRT|nr:hypothetical protein MLD38_022012 [Melastoma candidum]
MRKKASPKRKNVGIFRDVEIRSADGYKKGSSYIEVTCGCTSKGHGDIVGKLRVYRNGLFLISCECSSECSQGLLTPHGFEKHAHSADSSGMVWSWKNHIWVTMGEVKLPLSKTSLISHYKFSANEENEVSSHHSHRRKFHRDEFVRCSKCKKERRFHLQNKEECRIYHDAVANRHWKCADKLHDKISCEEDEERDSRKRCRGCPRFMRCEGCSECVCLGCLECRYFDCQCRTCVDFIRNAQP